MKRAFCKLGDPFPMSKSGTVDSCHPYPALLEKASRVLPPTGEKWAVGMARTGTAQEEQEKGHQLPHGAGWEHTAGSLAIQITWFQQRLFICHHHRSPWFFPL